MQRISTEVEARRNRIKTRIAKIDEELDALEDLRQMTLEAMKRGKG